MNRHPIELLSLLSGLVFLAFALTYIVGTGLGSPPSPVITLPLLLVGLGGAGLVTAFVAQNRSRRSIAGDDGA